MRNRGLLAGVASAAVLAAIGAVQMVTAQSGARTISIYNIHTKETVTVTYKKGGKYIDAGLEQLNHAMRDYRRNEQTKMDPELIDLMWEVHNELGSKEPIHLISGFRSRATNEQLRKTVGGQASESRHILGKAADVHFPDVPVKTIRYSALIKERGGVGYYPTSAIPFVHLDTDRVRSWPRLPRAELALLFPSGATKHTPVDGGPITHEDVRVAQASYGDLASQIAAFHDDRKGGLRATLAVADAGKSPQLMQSIDREPRLRPQVASLAPPVAEPRLLEPPHRLATLRGTDPSARDRARLTELAALASATPQLVSGPVPVQRPRPPTPALASLTGGSLPVPGILEVILPKAPAPRLASINPAVLPSVEPQATDTGRFAWTGSWSVAPAYDEEHPDELSYRPFPIAPFLTATATEPLMADLVAHDVARTVDLIDQQTTVLPLRFSPGAPTARLMWAQQFTGEAIDLSKLKPEVPDKSGVQNRAVRTSQK